MVEELDTQSGMKANAILKILKDARKMDFCGTLNALLVSIVQGVVFALQIVLTVGQISAYLAQNHLKEGELENHYSAHLVRKTKLHYVIHLAKQITMEWDQFAGMIAKLLGKMNAVAPCA